MKYTESEYDLVYHFNVYDSRWYCMHRNQYTRYWNTPNNKYASGKTIEEARKVYLKRAQ